MKSDAGLAERGAVLNGRHSVQMANAMLPGARKTIPTVTPERVQLSIRTRFNPIRGLTPALLSTQLDNFQAGFIAWCALTWDAIERRDDVLKGVAGKRKKDV